MSKIFRTPSSRQKEFNLITESPWLGSEFLKQTIYTFELSSLCIRCPSYTRKTTTSFNKGMCTVHRTVLYFVYNPNSQNNDITHWIIVNFGISNPQIIKSIPLLVPIQNCVRKLHFKLRQLHNFLHAVFLRNQITAPDVTQFAFVVTNVDRNYVYF